MDDGGCGYKTLRKQTKKDIYIANEETPNIIIIFPVLFRA